LKSSIKKLLMLLVILTLIVSLTGCSSGTKDTQESDTTEAENTATGANQETQLLSMATGGSAGVYYYLGAGFANMVQKYYPEIRINAQTTAGGFENARLIAKGEADFGFAAVGVMQYMKNSENLEISGVSHIGGGHPGQIHVVTMANSGITKMEDLKGKKVAVGPQGSATLLLWSRNFLEAGWGLTEGEDYDPVYYSFDETCRGLIEGTIDAGIIITGYPTASILDLSSTHNIRLLEVDPVAMEKITTQIPQLVEDVIPAGTYQGIDEDIVTVYCWERMICRKDLPEDTVYKFLKAIYDHPEEKNAINPSAKTYNFDHYAFGTIEDGIEMHPGAIKYYKEKGVMK
jgi:TRAP transporter TAXI family solute receptor